MKQYQPFHLSSDLINIVDMTTSTTLSGRNVPPRPPAKGSFPLDHLGECALFARQYEECLRENGGHAGKCRAAARKYLACRMETDLMAREDFRNLGLDEERDSAVPQSNIVNTTNEEEMRSSGFVSGMKLAQRRKERKPRDEEGVE